MCHGKPLSAAIVQSMLRPRRFPATRHRLEDGLRADDVEICFMLTRERSGDTVLVHCGGAYSRDKLREAVASYQVRDGADDVIPQVEWMHLIHHRDGQGETIRHAVIHPGKAAEIGRLATYQSSIK